MADVEKTSDVAPTVSEAMASAPAPIKQATEALKTIPKHWLRDDKGRPSITATLVFSAFIITSIAYVFSIFPPITVFGHALAFKTFDVAACGAYLAPIIALYGGRKWTEKHYDTKPAVANGEEG